jgi:hypothetical protein
LAAARLVPRKLAAIEHRRAMRDLHVRQIVGEHEVNPFVLADALAELESVARIAEA